MARYRYIAGFSSGTIIRENLLQHLISCCNMFVILNYLRKNISMYAVYEIELIFCLVLEATTFYIGICEQW